LQGCLMSTSTISDTATKERAEWRKPPPNPSKKLDPTRLPPFALPLKRGNGRKFYWRSSIEYYKHCLQAAALGHPLPEKPSPPIGDPLVPHRKVAEEFGVSTRQIDRWVTEARTRAETNSAKTEEVA
jgi:hypothetical protein